MSISHKSKATKSSAASAESVGGAAKSRPLASSESGLVGRICLALDMTAYSLAKTLGVPARDVLELLNIPANQLVDVDRSIILTSMASYVDDRIGALLAIRDELQAKMNEDIKRRIVQRGRFS